MRLILPKLYLVGPCLLAFQPLTKGRSITILVFLQVAVVAFKKAQLKILSLEWDRDLGGKDFDEVLFNHFVEEFDAKYKLDIRSNKRASFRLRLAVEKVQLASHLT